MAVQAGEDGARWHHLAGLVPAMSVAEPGGVALTLLIQDGIQPGGGGNTGNNALINRSILNFFFLTKKDFFIFPPTIVYLKLT